MSEQQSEWTKVDSAIVADYDAFRIRRTRARSPRTHDVHEFHVVDRRHCVQIVAHAEDGRLIMVEQYRPGVERVTLEFPAGVLDEGEDPVSGALRELAEETGYRARNGRVIARADLDPAIETSIVHIVIATDCARAGEPKQDDGEAVVLRLIPEEDIEQLIRTGEIGHTAAIATWYFYRSSS